MDFVRIDDFIVSIQPHPWWFRNEYTQQARDLITKEVQSQLSFFIFVISVDSRGNLYIVELTIIITLFNFPSNSLFSTKSSRFFENVGRWRLSTIFNTRAILTDFRITDLSKSPISLRKHSSKSWIDSYTHCVLRVKAAEVMEDGKLSPLMISCHCFLLMTSTRPPRSVTRLYNS